MIRLVFLKKELYICKKIIVMKKFLTLQNLGWVLTALASVMMIMSGTQKVIGTTEMVNNFTYLKLLPCLTLVGVLELTGVVLLVYNHKIEL